MSSSSCREYAVGLVLSTMADLPSGAVIARVQIALAIVMDPFLRQRP